MSRRYEISVWIKGFTPEKKEAIRKAAEEEWGFDHKEWRENEDETWNRGRDDLASDEDEESFSQELAETVWKANGGFCWVEVSTLYLDDLPYRVQEFGKEEFEELVQLRKGGSHG